MFELRQDGERLDPFRHLFAKRLNHLEGSVTKKTGSLLQMVDFLGQ